MKKLHIGLIVAGAAIVTVAYKLIDKHMQMKHVEKYNENVVQLAAIANEKTDTKITCDLLYVH